MWTGTKAAGDLVTILVHKDYGKKIIFYAIILKGMKMPLVPFYSPLGFYRLPSR